VPSNQSALLNTTVPCWMVLMGAFGRRAHRPGPLSLTGLLLGALGALLLIDPWRHGAHESQWPELVMLGGCLGWAINSVYQRTMGARLAVASLIGWQMLIGGAMLGTLGLLTGETARWHWQWRALLPLSYLVIAASCLAHTAYAWLAPRTTPTLLGTYAYVNPLIATLLGWWMLDEVLNGTQLVGMLLVFASVLLINWAARSGR
jgi:drug/metabolite transporter (DMT)-like permease